MKRLTSNATVCAYIGAILIIASYFPGLDELLDGVPILHAIWHVETFVGAALLIYGLETLRRCARRNRRLPL